jgi:hypothetical protein
LGVVEDAQIHKEQQLIFSLNGKRAYSFKEGSTQIETKFNQWDKDAKAVTIYLKLEKLGEYTITVKPINKTVSSSLMVTIYEQNSRLNYFQMFFFFLLITFFIYKYFKWKHQQNREEERGIYYHNQENESILDFLWVKMIAWIAFFIALLIFFNNTN